MPTFSAQTARILTKNANQKIREDRAKELSKHFEAVFDAIALAANQGKCFIDYQVESFKVDDLIWLLDDFLGYQAKRRVNPILQRKEDLWICWSDR